MRHIGIKKELAALHAVEGYLHAVDAVSKDLGALRSEVQGLMLRGPPRTFPHALFVPGVELRSTGRIEVPVLGEAGRTQSQECLEVKLVVLVRGPAATSSRDLDNQPVEDQRPDE